MNSKFELLLGDVIEYLGIKLYRIRALNSFGNVKAGDIGGYIEKKRIYISMAKLGSLVMLWSMAMLGSMAMLWSMAMLGSMVMLRTTFTKMAHATLAKGPCKEIV